MARKKRHGGRRGMLSKIGRKAGSFAGTAVQLIGVSHGLVTAVPRALAEGGPQRIPAAVLRDYSGYNLEDGSFDQGIAIKSLTILGVSFLVGWGIKQIARRM